MKTTEYISNTMPEEKVIKPNRIIINSDIEPYSVNDVDENGEEFSFTGYRYTQRVYTPAEYAAEQADRLGEQQEAIIELASLI